MKLLPAFLVIIAVFGMGFLFLQARKQSFKTPLFRRGPLVILLVVAGLSLMVFGKIALLIALAALAILLIPRMQ